MAEVIVQNTRVMQGLNLKEPRKDEEFAENADCVDHTKVSQASNSEETRHDEGYLENADVPQSLIFEESEKDKDSVENAEVLQGLETGNHVGWGNMVNEVLVEIFMRLSCNDRLQSVQLVCKSWKASAWDHGCWEVVHMDQLCTETIGMVTKERVLKLIVDHCVGGIHELIFPSTRHEGLQCLAQGACSSLQTLRIPSAEINDAGICGLVPHLPALSVLDISDCRYVTAAAFKVIGENCKGLTKLTRRGMLMRSSDDSEAQAISEYMPKLRYLDISGGLLSNEGLLAILENCRDLETVDLIGCSHIDIYDESFKSRFASMQLKVDLIGGNNSSSSGFMGDVYDNYYDEDYDDDYHDYENSDDDYEYYAYI